jgi:hypothetical protein
MQGEFQSSRNIYVYGNVSCIAYEQEYGELMASFGQIFWFRLQDDSLLQVVPVVIHRIVGSAFWECVCHELL